MQHVRVCEELRGVGILELGSIPGIQGGLSSQFSCCDAIVMRLEDLIRVGEPSITSCIIAALLTSLPTVDLTNSQRYAAAGHLEMSGVTAFGEI